MRKLAYIRCFTIRLFFLLPSFVELEYDVLDKCRQLRKRRIPLVNCTADRQKTNYLTSAVQEPELDGWKKLSVETIKRARESNALQPAR